MDLGTGAPLTTGTPWTCSDPRLAGTSIPLDACVVSSDLGPLLAVLLRDDRLPSPGTWRCSAATVRAGAVEAAQTGLRPFAIAAADLYGSRTPVLAVSCQNSHHVNLWTLAPRAADANGPERTVASKPPSTWARAGDRSTSCRSRDRTARGGWPSAPTSPTRCSSTGRADRAIRQGAR